MSEIKPMTLGIIVGPAPTRDSLRITRIIRLWRRRRLHDDFWYQQVAWLRAAWSDLALARSVSGQHPIDAQLLPGWSSQQLLGYWQHAGRHTTIPPDYRWIAFRYRGYPWDRSTSAWWAKYGASL